MAGSNDGLLVGHALQVGSNCFAHQASPHGVAAW